MLHKPVFRVGAALFAVIITVMGSLVAPGYRAQAFVFGSVGFDKGCRNGFIVTGTVTNGPSPDSGAVVLTSTSPSGDTGTVVSSSVPGSATGTFVGAWASPQTPGTTASVHGNFVSKGSILFSFTLGGTIQDCFVTLPTNTFFNPNDGRIDGRAGDRIAVWCNASANPATLDVWGVFNDSSGHRLFTFNFADLVKAGAKGIVKKIEPLGTVFAVVDANNNFFVNWTGGPAAATGHGDFAKSFTCGFAR